jgi:hypothetical protein
MQFIISILKHFRLVYQEYFKHEYTVQYKINKITVSQNRVCLLLHVPSSSWRISILNGTTYLSVLSADFQILATHCQKFNSRLRLWILSGDICRSLYDLYNIVNVIKQILDLKHIQAINIEYVS